MFGKGENCVAWSWHYFTFLPRGVKFPLCLLSQSSPWVQNSKPSPKSCWEWLNPDLEEHEFQLPSLFVSLLKKSSLNPEEPLLAALSGIETAAKLLINRMWGRKRSLSERNRDFFASGVTGAQKFICSTSKKGSISPDCTFLDLFAH